LCVCVCVCVYVCVRVCVRAFVCVYKATQSSLISFWFSQGSLKLEVNSRSC